MLKWYAETFKLTEKQMTTKALRRIWVLTGISLFVLPIMLILDFGNLTGAPLLAVRMAYYISVICIVCLAFTKFMNRFWSRDKYLDEWERERKHQAMAFAFQVLAYSAFVIAIIGIFSDGESVRIPEFGLYTLGLIVMSFMGFGIFIMHIYLLVTTKPIDSFDELRNDLSLDEVI